MSEAEAEDRIHNGIDLVLKMAVLRLLFNYDVFVSPRLLNSFEAT
jgi:hypothetical protein